MADEEHDPKRKATLTIEEHVDMWREETMLNAGYPPDIALRLAMDHGVDLHRAVDLLGYGCAPATAELILST